MPRGPCQTAAVREILPGVHHWTTVHARWDITIHSYWLAAERVLIDPRVPDEGIEWFADSAARRGPPHQPPPLPRLGAVPRALRLPRALQPPGRAGVPRRRAGRALRRRRRAARRGGGARGGRHLPRRDLPPHPRPPRRRLRRRPGALPRRRAPELRPGPAHARPRAHQGGPARGLRAASRGSTSTPCCSPTASPWWAAGPRPWPTSPEPRERVAPRSTTARPPRSCASGATPPATAGGSSGRRRCRCSTRSSTSSRRS